MIPNEDSSSDTTYGRGKIGTSFWVGNDYVDFFTAFGIPNIDMSIGNISFSTFYLVGELHFKLFIADNYVSFMTRPALYNEISKAKRGDNYDMDLNYRLNFSLPDFPLSWGLYFNFLFNLS